MVCPTCTSENECEKETTTAEKNIPAQTQTPLPEQQNNLIIKLGIISLAVGLIIALFSIFMSGYLLSLSTSYREEAQRLQIQIHQKEREIQQLQAQIREKDLLLAKEKEQTTVKEKEQPQPQPEPTQLKDKPVLWSIQKDKEKLKRLAPEKKKTR